MSNSIADSFRVDRTRIRDADGFVATVRYVGPVASAKKRNEIYVGVEWDDKTRGKHDGSVICRQTNELVRHFSVTNSSPLAGSFLRLHKVDTGVDFNLELIKSRYVEPDAPLVAPNNVLPYYARTSSGRQKVIEFLGEMDVRKRQQLEDMDDISLRGMGISGISAKCSEEMLKTFKHVKEIDLAGNLFCDWGPFFEIMAMFPLLEWVSFASNKIHDIPPTLSFEDGQWSRLKVLNINSISIESFQTILKLERLCPNLEDLCIAYSNLSDMSKKDTTINDNADVPALTGFKNLKLLDCSSCNISNWKTQVRQFRQLPKLEYLVLDDNPISYVEMSKSDAEMEFTNLKNLHIAGGEIKNWNGIEDIANFANLKALRFKKSTLTDKIGTGEARAGTIARIPQIEVLNQSQISKKERAEAERRYVSTVSREMLQATSSAENDATGTSNEENDRLHKHSLIFKKYPRFEELMVKHKDTMIAAQSSISDNSTISSNAVNVTIRSMAAESCTREPLQKRLPSSMKVERLKIMCARAFGLDIELQMLHFRSEGDPFPTELDDNENTIGYYGVSDGAEILMNEIDLEAIKRDDKNKAELHKRRIDEQEHASNALQAIQKSDRRAHLTAAEKASNQMSK
jgi:hypothetical protein